MECVSDQGKHVPHAVGEVLHELVAFEVLRPQQVRAVLSHQRIQLRDQLMCRYAGAVHRYLLKALGDSDAAAELNQEFALRFLRGDFRHGDPIRGRFRDYVKRTVQNLMKGRPVSPGAFRQALQRARRQYTGYLLDEVGASLDDPTPAAIEEELADLQLLEHCRPYLKQRG